MIPYRGLPGDICQDDELLLVMNCKEYYILLLHHPETKKVRRVLVEFLENLPAVYKTY